MTKPRVAQPPLGGDAHNFGRRVTVGEARVAKPRTLFWEWLVLSRDSPLRQRLAGLGETFDFLPDLAFSDPRAPGGGEVDRVALDPLGPGASPEALARVTGRAIALFSWLGVSDLHWENLVLGQDASGRIVFAPLDVEIFFADMELPTETKLLPDVDPDGAETSRHACGVRRVLPLLGKPVDGPLVVEIAAAYLEALALLDRNAKAIAGTLSMVEGLAEAPIRVLLRGTGDYVRARAGKPAWPPLLDAERAQLDRGDIPYFFRLYGQPGIRWFSEPTLTRVEQLPTAGDVPRLEPSLQLSRELRSKKRKKLREEGLFTVIGAFDHPAIRGAFKANGLGVTFRGKTLVIELAGREVLETKRDLGRFVGSAYLPCGCGEVRSVFVPPVTVCETAPREGGPRERRRPA